MPAELTEVLGYEFADERLLTAALTHRSTGDATNYERLEFLGDRVLGLVIADLLVAAFPIEPEGDLSRRFHALVRRESLAEIARAADLAPHIRLGAPEAESGERENDAILADIFEALLGAVYLDGGLDPVREIVERHFGAALNAAVRPPLDAKTGLQEWAQARGRKLPVYELAGREGPDHAPVFTVSVSVEGGDAAEGGGPSKRAAEQEAAARLLARLENE